MKKLFLMFALVAFIGANSVTKAASYSSGATVECEKCGNKDGKCSEGKKAKKGKSCHAEGAAATEGSTEGEAPKSCGSKKKSCCKAKASAANENKTEETAPVAK